MTEVVSVNAETWGPFASFFAANEPGCFCRWPRVAPRRFVPDPATNREAMHELVHAGCCPGLLALRDGEAVGWCAAGPVAEFPQYERGEPGAWAIACLLVAESARNEGVGRALIEAAVSRARSRGAGFVYGPPPWWSAGGEEVRDRVVAMLTAHGFEEMEPGARTPLLRKRLGPSASTERHG